MKPPLTPEFLSASALAWPVSLTALRQLFPGRRVEAGVASLSKTVPSTTPEAPLGWSTAGTRKLPPEPVVVPPTAPFTPPPPPRGNFRIHCLPLGPSAELSERVKVECDQHDALGYTLASSFSHDGHAFLIFRRK